jgi:hypothetical protein
MAQITTGDVTYTQIGLSGIASAANPMRQQMFTVLIPASGATNVLYTNGGIPLSPAALGCPANLMSLILIDEGSTTGYVAKFDYGKTSLRLYLSQNTTGASTTTSLIEVVTSATVASVTLRVMAQGW